MFWQPHSQSGQVKSKWPSHARMNQPEVNAVSAGCAGPYDIRAVSKEQASSLGLPQLLLS